MRKYNIFMLHCELLCRETDGKNILMLAFEKETLYFLVDLA